MSNVNYPWWKLETFTGKTGGNNSSDVFGITPRRQD